MTDRSTTLSARSFLSPVYVKDEIAVYVIAMAATIIGQVLLFLYPTVEIPSVAGKVLILMGFAILLALFAEHTLQYLNVRIAAASRPSNIHN